MSFLIVTWYRKSGEDFIHFFFSLKSEFSHCYFNYATIFYSEKCVFLYRLQLCFGYHLKKKVQTLIIILIIVMKIENVLDYWYGK